MPSLPRLAPIFLSIIVLITLPFASAQSPQITTGATEIRARLGPGYDYPRVEILPPESLITPLGISPDEAWIQVEYFTLRLWIEHSQLNLSEDTSLPTITDYPPEPDLPYEQCISLVGDSVPNGEVVYMVPGYGFGVLRTTPLSIFLQESLDAAGLGYLEVRDRTASAAFLSDEGKKPYHEMEAYEALMEDNCRFVIMMPWINDLSVEVDDPAQEYLNNMTALLENLREATPESEIIVLGFYYGQRADFVEIYAPGYTDENIVLFNALTLAACESTWFEIGGITCIVTENLFDEMQESYVVLSNNQTEVEASLYEPIPSDVAAFFGAYWDKDSENEVIGDGVHLNQAGKQRLAEALVETLIKIAPKL